jgi:hypothetical protein
MTEAQWLTSSSPWELVYWMIGVQRAAVTTDERFRRFGIACCRRLAGALAPGHISALDQLDQYIDAGSPSGGLRLPRKLCRTVPLAPVTTPPSAASHAVRAVEQCLKSKCSQAAMASEDAARAMNETRAVVGSGGGRKRRKENPELAVQAALIRDIFANPFRPVAFSPEWRTNTAVSLARQMYESRDFSAMPILADALQDAGCDNEDVLNHCRHPGVHVRGCWCVDLLLGKE